MVLGVGCVVWIPAFAGMTEGVGWKGFFGTLTLALSLRERGFVGGTDILVSPVEGEGIFWNPHPGPLPWGEGTFGIVLLAAVGDFG